MGARKQAGFSRSSRKNSAGARPLFDVVHNTQLGVKIRGWAVFEELIPILEQYINEGIVPRIPQKGLNQHPYMKESYTIRKPGLMAEIRN